jgi:hypothetical protein
VSASVSGSPPPAAEGTPPAGERLAALRAGIGASGEAVPASVWEDATGQLAGMLEGLARLREAVPALGEPVPDDVGVGPGAPPAPERPAGGAGSGEGRR